MPGRKPLLGWLIPVGRWTLGVSLAALFVFFLGRAVATGLDRASSLTLAPSVLMAATAALSMLLWLGLVELAWEAVLRKLCVAPVDVPWRATALAFFRSMLARYVPGRIWQFALRARDLQRLGIPPEVITRALLFEQMHSASATAVLAIPVLLLLLGRGQTLPWAYVLSAGLVLAVGGVWLLRPDLLFSLTNKLAGAVLRRDFELLARPQRRRSWAAAFGLYLAVAIGQGLVIVPLLITLKPADLVLSAAQWCMVCGAYPVARLLGQLSVVFPAGLGVREGAYVVMTLAVIDVTVASAVAIWARLLSVGVEITWWLVLWVISRRDVPEMTESVSADKSGTR